MNFNANNSPYLGVILAVISLIPVVLTLTVFRPKFKKVDFKKLNNKEKILSLINILLYIVSVLTLVIRRNNMDIKNANVWFGVMLFWIVMYYELYIRYLVRGKAQKELYSPILYVRVPLYISMALSILFAGIWAKDAIIIIPALIFSVTNIYSAYKRYMKCFTEYRDLYDKNRKPTGRKMLKDGYKPKDMKYVTVVVFIFNPVTKKWLMQKRTKDKGGKWATTSGHPVSGQSSIEGMITEIKEEVGLSVLEDNLKYVTTVERKDKFADIYYLEENVDESTLVLQKEEVDDIKWMSSKEVDQLYKNNKFKKTHYKYFTKLKSIIKNN